MNTNPPATVERARQSTEGNEGNEDGSPLFVPFVCYCSKLPSTINSYAERPSSPTAEPWLLEHPKLQGCSPKRNRRFGSEPLFGDLLQITSGHCASASLR